MTVLGIDIGGTYLRAAVADARGAILSESIQTASGLDPQRLAAALREIVATCSESPSVVAVGLPAPVDAAGEVGHLVNLPALSDVPVRALLEEELAVPVVVENDVNLAALGEQRRGCARNADDLVFIAIGTGVGMGIVSGGALLRGAHGGAGELGQLPLGPGRVVRDLRELGPLEAVAGGAGLARHWSEHTSRLSSGRDVLEAAAAGDAAASALLDAQASTLAMGVRAVQAILDPQLFVFGGGIGSRRDVFDRLQAVLSTHGVPVPRMALSALGETAALVGAIEAALDASVAREATSRQGRARNGNARFDHPRYENDSRARDR